MDGDRQAGRSGRRCLTRRSAGFSRFASLPSVTTRSRISIRNSSCEGSGALTELSAFAEVQAAFERGDHADVLRRTEAILAERPGDDAAHELRARSLLALGRVPEAEAEVENAVRLDPDEI